MNTRPDITQPPVAPCAGRLIQTTDKTKIQTQSSAFKITTALNPAHQRKKTQQLTSSHQSVNTNHTLCGAYTKHWTNLIRAETNRKKEFDYEAWEKEALTISFKIIIVIKRQKYCTKEQPRDTEV